MTCRLRPWTTQTLGISAASLNPLRPQTGAGCCCHMRDVLLSHAFMQSFSGFMLHTLHSAAANLGCKHALNGFS